MAFEAAATLDETDRCSPNAFITPRLPPHHRGLAANFSLHYDLTPYVGVLRSGVVGTSKTVHFPAAEARR